MNNKRESSVEFHERINREEREFYERMREKIYWNHVYAFIITMLVFSFPFLLFILVAFLEAIKGMFG